ncbi:unnamed protein product, partial [Dicrocoelium dendriticum]
MALWDCLLQRGVPEKYTSTLHAIYHQTSGRVRAYGEISPPFSITSGVRQGCPASPLLFNFTMDVILDTALDNSESCGVELSPGDRLRDLEYADDIAVICESSQVVQDVLLRLEMSAAQFGLSLPLPNVRSYYTTDQAHVHLSPFRSIRWKWSTNSFILGVVLVLA